MFVCLADQAVYTPAPVAMFSLLSTVATGATRLQVRKIPSNNIAQLPRTAALGIGLIVVPCFISRQVNPQLGSFSLGTYNATYDQARAKHKRTHAIVCQGG